ncbi:MAG: O-antigen ligase family protein [Gammaproteobacteria bacterium]|nr:O-antigen ligase family protein [Gammaproteobacteria bacterium]MBU1723560.1 O-antigen ligase family protein [Gammaproteobacteria bacterium]MBU2004118.1 O-antigen ligase family protein [Gammaproteobacteria bacterium]
MRTLILGLFALHFIFLAYLNNVYLAGLPVRSFLILLLGGLIFLQDHTVLARLNPVNLVYALLAIIGLIISILNDVPLADIFNGVLKLLQSYLLILAAYFIMEQYGFRTLAIVFIGIALPSALIGILQGINVEAAWQWHRNLMDIQNKELSDEILAQITEVLMRPPGLALYAIPQTYMLLAAIILTLYAVLRRPHDQPIQLLGAGVLLILAGGIFASETRSAMGAALVMPAIIYLRLFPTKVIPLGILLLIAGTIAFLSFGGHEADVDSRLVSLDDASAIGRSTLYKYGTELFLQQPFGYGFNFDTVEYATEYFVNEHNLFRYEPYEKAQYIVPVHNSILNLIHTYGFAGLLLLGYYVFRLVGGSWYRAVFIIGAFLNSLFHNAGILSNDLFMDIVLAVMLFETNRQQTMTPISQGAMQTA